jgi:tRNA 2-thiouridine synthesizing protein A
MMIADVELDVRQLACPLPILRAKKSLSAMSDGQVLKILATDPESPKDFEVFCRQTRNELLSTAEDAGEFTFMIRRVSVVLPPASS